MQVLLLVLALLLPLTVRLKILGISVPTHSTRTPPSTPMGPEARLRQTASTTSLGPMGVRTAPRPPRIPTRSMRLSFTIKRETTAAS